MAKRKKFTPYAQPLKHKAAFKEFMETTPEKFMETTPAPRNKTPVKTKTFTKYNFKLNEGTPLFRLDTLETVE